MADVSIDSSISSGPTARSMRAIAFHRTNQDVGYAFAVDSDGTFGYYKSTDGGASWGAQVEIAAATTHVAFDIWADWWTPGDTGTLIHTWYYDTTNDDVFWRSLDTSSDTLGTQQTVLNGGSAVAGRGTFVSGTKTRSGYLYCAFDIDAGAEKGLHRSTDSGATWSTNLSTTFVEATTDEALLFPASNTGDDNDCWAVYLDASADALTLKMWDSSGASESESATIQTHIDNTTDGVGQHGYSGSVRHSDGHIILAACSERDTATADHQVYDINGTGSITTLTAITTDIDDHYYPAVFIDNLGETYDLYVAFNGLRDGSETLGTTTKVYYTKSTDDGSSWSAGSTAYMEGATAAVAQVWVSLCGARFYPAWRVAATTVYNGNKVNSLTFAAPTNPTGTDTATVTEAASLTATITATDTETVSETLTIAISHDGQTEILAITEGQAVSAAITTTDSLTVTDSAVAESGGQSGSGSDTGTLSESAGVTVDVVAVDAWVVSEIAGLTAAAVATDQITTSEAAAVIALVVAADSGTLTDAGLAVLFSFTGRVEGLAAILERLDGVASLTPRTDGTGDILGRLVGTGDIL